MQFNKYLSYAALPRQFIRLWAMILQLFSPFSSRQSRMSEAVRMAR